MRTAIASPVVRANARIDEGQHIVFACAIVPKTLELFLQRSTKEGLRPAPTQSRQRPWAAFLASGSSCGATFRWRLGARRGWCLGTCWGWCLRWHIGVLPMRGGEGAGGAEDQLRQTSAGRHVALDCLAGGVCPTG